MATAEVLHRQLGQAVTFHLWHCCSFKLNDCILSTGFRLGERTEDLCSVRSPRDVANPKSNFQISLGTPEEFLSLE